MTTEQIKAELQNKIKEFEMQSKLVSLEVINRLNDLIKKMEEEKQWVVSRTYYATPIQTEDVVTVNNPEKLPITMSSEEKPIRSRWKSKWK